MATKVKLKELKEMVESLNESGLLEEEIETDDAKKDALFEAFTEAMETIDDDGQVGEVDDEVVEYYESFGEEEEEEEEGEEEEEDENPDEPDDDITELTSRAKIRRFIQNKKLDVVLGKGVKGDALREVRDEIREALAGKKGGKGKGKATKIKSDKKGKGKADASGISIRDLKKKLKALKEAVAGIEELLDEE